MYLNLEAERIRRQMSRATLARKLSVDTATLDDWIHRRRAIPANKLRALSQIFQGCTVDYLLKATSKNPFELCRIAGNERH
jgi:transcriptional regulator with XRE-family HTH domain